MTSFTSYGLFNEKDKAIIAIKVYIDELAVTHNKNFSHQMDVLKGIMLLFTACFSLLLIVIEEKKSMQKH